MDDSSRPFGPIKSTSCLALNFCDKTSVASSSKKFQASVEKGAKERFKISI